MAENLIIGTAGHVDHGKSTLVKVLTGTDPDRLNEEKKRGITIDLGFASMQRGKMLVSFVDVPGHERLVKNMIAGASGFDACLFAVDASEKIMPQTEEHLSIIETFGVKNAIVAITKSDLLDENELKESKDIIKSFFKDSALENIIYISTSIKKSETIENLKNEIFNLAGKLPERNSKSPYLMRIDRSFSIKGKGTIITGTADRGIISLSDTPTLYPGSEKVKIKGINVHGQNKDEAFCGQRVALNIADKSKDDFSRGDILTNDNSLKETEGFYAKIKLFDRLKEGVSVHHNRTYPIFIGAQHLNGRIIILDGQREINKEGTFAFIRLDRKFTPLFGEPFLIRSLSPQLTVAGGKVIAIKELFKNRKDAAQVLQSIDNPEKVIEKLSDIYNEGFKLTPFQQFSDQTEENISKIAEKLKIKTFETFYLPEKRIKTIISRLLGILNKAGKVDAGLIKASVNKLPAGAKKHIEAILIEEAKKKGFSYKNGSIIKEQRTEFDIFADKIYAAMAKDPAKGNPVHLAEIVRSNEKQVLKGLEYLKNRDRIVKLDERVFVTDIVAAEFTTKAIEEAKKTGYVDIAGMRKYFDFSRKLMVPLLDYLDRSGKFTNKDNKRYLK